jgi:hypothetical protein
VPQASTSTLPLRPICGLHYPLTRSTDTWHLTIATFQRSWVPTCNKILVWHSHSAIWTLAVAHVAPKITTSGARRSISGLFHRTILRSGWGWESMYLAPCIRVHVAGRAAFPGALPGKVHLW